MLFTGLARSILGKTVPSGWVPPSAEFLPIRTPQPVNNIYIYTFPWELTSLSWFSSFWWYIVMLIALWTPAQSVLILTVSLHLLWSWIHNCIPYTCPIHSRYMTGNLWKILLVWNWIPYGGWMLAYGRIPMKAELVEGVVVLCGRWTVLAEAGVT